MKRPTRLHGVLHLIAGLFLTLFSGCTDHSRVEDAIGVAEADGVDDSGVDTATDATPDPGPEFVPVPCNVWISPTALEFGEVPVGQHKSLSVDLGHDCSNPVDVVAFTNAFEFGHWSVQPSLAPITIPVGEVGSFEVVFSPNDSVYYQAAVEVSSFDGIIAMPVRGTGIETRPECPTARMRARPSDADTWVEPPEMTVEPGDIALDGSLSTDYLGNPVAQYIWTLHEKPEGHEVGFVPNSRGESPELQVLEPGTYRVGLDVYDQNGISNCEPEEMLIHVVRAP